MLTSQQTLAALQLQYTGPIFISLGADNNRQYRELNALVKERNWNRFGSIVCSLVDDLGYGYARNRCDGWVELKWPKRRVMLYLWEHFSGARTETQYVRYKSELHVIDNPETNANSAAEACAMSDAKKIEERRDWLYNQYGLSIENDAGMRRVLDSYLCDDKFMMFTDFVGRYMREVRDNHHKKDVFSDTDYKFLQVTLWDYLDGNGDNKNYLAYLTCVNNQLPTPVPPLQPITLNELEKDTIMNADQLKTIPVKTITYIYGRDVGNMSTDDLINAVKQVEAEIEALSKIKTASTKIDAMKAELETALAEIVKALDAS